MKKLMIILCFSLLAIVTKAQNFTSTNNGSWTTGANWGGTAPATSGQTFGAIVVNHNINTPAGYDFRGGSLTVNAGKTLTINGNFSISNGPTVRVYGNMIITGNASLSANFIIYPGGSVTVNGSMTVVSSQYLTVGTNAAGPPYADLIVKTNLISQSSGDITVERNGRVAVFGNLTSSGGGTNVDIKNGGQVYVNGNIALSGGGDSVSNGNGVTPIGLYVNGTSTSTGGGSSITPNKGNKATMQVNNPPFFSWVSGIPGSPLPIKLSYFIIDDVSDKGISIRWATSMEKDFDYFLLERASSDLNFVTVATVQEAGGLEVETLYNFTDANPLSGKNYYRLKSVDIDKSSVYSAVIVAEYGGAEHGVAIYPTIIKDYGFNLTFNDSNFSLPVQMQLLNKAGAVSYQTTLQATTNWVEIPGESKPGVYLVKLISNTQQKIVRVVVQ